MPHKFTLRNSGHRMTKVSVDLHLTEESVAFAMKELGVGQEAAIKAITDRLTREMSNHISWRTLTAESGDEGRRLALTHNDHVEDLEESATTLPHLPTGEHFIIAG